MIKETIALNEAGQRFDKYLHKYLKEAPSSFLYKMLRKKNITLNNKKADGSELLQTGDEAAFFLAAETIAKFRGEAAHSGALTNQYEAAYTIFKNKFQVIYEDDFILLLNKPAGVLTQKAEESDTSLNEAMIGYLLKTGALTPDMLRTFKPSVCNRLDRNTSGIVICGKSLPGLQKMSALLKERTIHKFYRCIVAGQMRESCHLEGYLCKDHATNKVTISNEQSKDAVEIRTNYTPLQIIGRNTVVEVELITGKTHQIRAHLAATGFPIVGDYKYGNKSVNQQYKKNYALESQLLHAYRLEFPVMDGMFLSLSQKVVIAELPAQFKKIMEA